MAIAYFDCVSGISGDMTLAALIDAGVKPDALVAQLRTLGLPDFELRVEPVQRSGITAKHVTVVHDDDQPHRHYTDIVAMIAASGLAAPVQETATTVFRRLGEAEAKVHGVDLEAVHFHEVGAVDSIVDIVGVAIGLHLLDITAVYFSPVTMGCGMTTIDHGSVPVPVPATVELLQGIPVRQSEIEAELVTPTGAALVAALGQGTLPQRDWRMSRVGYGAGTRQLPHSPNLLRVRIGTLSDTHAPERIALLETNIDDMNQELYPWIIERLLEDGALDAYVTPILGKKGRPGHMLSVMSREADVQQHLACLFGETTTLGVRVQSVDRYTLPRESITIDTEYGPIAAKRIIFNGTPRITPEYEDCRRVARERSLPLARVYAAVHRAADTDAP